MAYELCAKNPEQFGRIGLHLVAKGENANGSRLQNKLFHYTQVTLKPNTAYSTSATALSFVPIFRSSCSSHAFVLACTVVVVCFAASREVHAGFALPNEVGKFCRQLLIKKLAFGP
jgi:hypothetical protein